MTPRALAGALLGAAIAAGATAAHAAPIIGGTPTAANEHPAVVALLVGDGLCTGTLIAPLWVLTAAHCVHPVSVGQPSQDAVTSALRIFIGGPQLAGIEPRRAAASVPHPAFVPSDLTRHDIALVRLAAPERAIAPLAVALDPAQVPIGITATLVGFGATAGDASGTAGRRYALAGRASSTCTAFGVTDAGLLCFAQDDGRGACRGDSGGPAIGPAGDVLGVTSFGDRDCAVLSAYTRTDAERAWLLAEVPPLERCTDDASCPVGDVCSAGGCIAPPFTETGLGSACATGDDCDSGRCADGPGGPLCTALCVPGGTDCPDDFHCRALEGDGAGACWPGPAPDDAGCCSAGGDPRGAALGSLLVALCALRITRRRTPR